MKLPTMARRRRQVNLLPRDSFEVSVLGVVLGWALTFGKWAVIITQLVVTGVFLTRFGYDRQLTDLNKEIAKQVAIIQSYNQIERDFTLTQNRVSQAKIAMSQNETMANILVLMQRKTPSDVWYERMMIGPNTTSIVANAGSLPGFSQFVTSLSTDQTFDSVVINNLQDGTKKGARFMFDITLSYGGKGSK